MEPADLPDRVLAKIALTIAAAIAGLVVVGTRYDPSPPYMMVHEVVADGLERWDDREIRVRGWIQAGSIREDRTGGELRHTFIMQSGGKQLRVLHRGPWADTFRDQSELVVDGRIVPAERLGESAPWMLEASRMAAKCASNYEGRADNSFATKL